jgi:GT2 family glycosyltransferase
LEVCKHGLQKSHAKFFVLLDSDMIVSEGWLENLMDQMETVPRLAACETLTNWDNKYIQKDGKFKSIQMAVYSDMIQQRVPNLKPLYDFMRDINKQCKGMFIERRWISMHATMFARSAVEEVGFDTGDLCNAFKKAGYKIGQTNGSVLFPFGHKTHDLKNQIWDLFALDKILRSS